MKICMLYRTKKETNNIQNKESKNKRKTKK